MSRTSLRQTLILTAIGAVVAGAPMAASAQGYGNDHRPQQQQQSWGNDRHDQGRPQSQPSHQSQPQRPSPQPSYRTGRYRVVATVNLRTGPGLNYRRIGSIYAGRTIEVDRVQAGWLHIRGQGWISAGFARRL